MKENSYFAVVVDKINEEEWELTMYEATFNTLILELEQSSEPKQETVVIMKDVEGRIR